MNVLITGGAGFIGIHLVRRLLREGCRVSILDNFSPQVHAVGEELPSDLVDHVELYRGDVRDVQLISRALTDQDVVVHLAAETGTGQSMYEICRYQDVNIGGTATILDLRNLWGRDISVRRARNRISGAAHAGPSTGRPV